MLLVRCISNSVGSVELHRNLLASSSWIVRRHDPFCDGNRLRCQLAQESHSSLRDYSATILDCCSGVPTVRLDRDARPQRFGLAIRTHRGRHRISTGMAVYEAFRIAALKLRLRVPGEGMIRSQNGDTSIHKY
jgi:hypothetical protein